jgi:uncharacterized protein (TIGR02145 family)
MRKSVIIWVVLLFAASIFLPPQAYAQAPDRMSYQAVIRDAENHLVTDQSVGMQISILRGSVNGTALYVETHTPTTNANGLVSIEIGAGTMVSGDFATLDWSAGPYFIKTETDPEGGTDYTITGVSQLVSVPYALHAKTAETVSENDPVYRSSVASGITNIDTTYWNNKLDSYQETDPNVPSYVKNIRPDHLAQWNAAHSWGDHSKEGYLTTYTESQILRISNDTIYLTGGSFVKLPPGFSGSYNDLSDVPKNMDTDATDDFDGQYSSLTGTPTRVSSFDNDAGYLTQNTETDPLFTAWDKTTGISITKDQIRDLGTYVDTETDPVFGTSVASGITSYDTTNWNNKLDSYTETDPSFTTWNKSTGILITESQISDLNHFTNADENDPVFSNWNKSTGISITENQISDLGSYIDTETDPVFGTSVASGITPSDTTCWNNKLDSYTETDPAFTAWDKSTGISITESQISDLNHFTNADETDPAYHSSPASGITSGDIVYWNNKMDSYMETDPVFTLWNKSTGISITESQISDLDHFTNADETDPVFSNWNKSTGISITESQISDLDHFTNADENDPVFSNWNKSTGISITESQISDLGAYLTTETDPAVSANFDFTDAADGDLLQFNGEKWVKVTPDYISSETDPTFTSSEAANITATDITNLGNLSGVNTGDQDLSALATKTALGDSTAQVRSEIPDVSGFLTAETDPTFTSSEAANITATDITNLGNLSGTNTGDQDLSTLATKTYVDILEEKIEKMENTNKVGGYLFDERDGNYYNTVKIGDQVWMAENLKYLPDVVGPGIGSETTPYYYVYSYDGTDVNAAKATENYTTYGVLYNWTAAMNGSASSSSNPSGVQGVCPTGWHLPSDGEWTELTDYIGGQDVAGGKLKETGTTHWISPNEGATNESGFSALPGGYRFYYSGGGFVGFYDIGYNGYWWSATEYYYSDYAWSWRLTYNSSSDYRNGNNKVFGFSVRCVRD